MPSRDLRLGLDTATSWLSLALVDADGRLVAHDEVRADRTHAAIVLPRLRDLFDEAEAVPDDLTAITVGVGPGSYTGVRIGLAVARGLAAGSGAPLGGADTLAMLAWAALRDGETGIAAIDARRGAAYVAVFRREGDRLRTLREAAKTDRAEAAAAHPEAAWIEDRAPAAAWAAARPPGERPPAAVYL